HIWGQQPYSRASSARDNPILALITYGEGYHNYHHAFQWDYRNGVKWWHYDPTKWMIRICSVIGLTRDLKRSSFAQIEKAKLDLQYRRATEKCESRQVSDKWRQLLEQEYQQFLHILELWSEPGLPRNAACKIPPVSCLGQEATASRLPPRSMPTISL
ncbi:MAG: acyl-CoA desaturase, partial [Chloroflexi bacterium]|nr:acyl-CoA desaturase [Chloroflexota bacterium]